jgi:hypothetical protein
MIAAASNPMRSVGRTEEEGNAVNILVTAVNPLAAEIGGAFALFFIS